MPIYKWVIAHYVGRMITNQSIIETIEKHCEKQGMAETTFGKKAVNDGKLLSRLRDGKSISIETYNRILAVVNDGAEVVE